MVIAYDELTSRPVGSFDSPSTGQTKSCADGLQVNRNFSIFDVQTNLNENFTQVEHGYTY